MPQSDAGGPASIGIINHPSRKASFRPRLQLYYDLVITAVSVIVAVVIDGIEGLGLLGDQLALHGWFWDGIGTLNDNFDRLGFATIGVFIFACVTSLIVYRYAPSDQLEVVTDKSR